MNQAIAEISRNPVLAGVVDPTSLVELAELAAKLAGADDDFKLRLNQDAVASNQLQKAIQQIEQTVMQEVAKAVTKPAADALAKESAKIDTIEKNVETLTGIVETLKKVISPGQPPQPAGGVPPASVAPPLPPQPISAPPTPGAAVKPTPPTP